MMRAHLAKRTAPLYIWLVSAGKPTEGKIFECPLLPCESHTLIDVLALNEAVEKNSMNIPTYVFYIIAQKCDFANKIIQQLSVAQSMFELEKTAIGTPISVTASSARCDGNALSSNFKRAVAASGRKRAAVPKTSEVELRRGWWTLLYWYVSLKQFVYTLALGPKRLTLISRPYG